MKFPYFRCLINPPKHNCLYLFLKSHKLILKQFYLKNLFKLKTLIKQKKNKTKNQLQKKFFPFCVKVCDIFTDKIEKWSQMKTKMKANFFEKKTLA